MADLAYRAEPTYRQGAMRQWDIVRCMMLCVTLFLIFVEPNPTSTTVHQQGAAGEVEGQLFQQMIWPSIALVALFSISYRMRVVLKQYEICLLLALGWYLLTTQFAIEPSVSIRRFIFMILVMFSLITTVAALEKHELVTKCIAVTAVVATLYAYFYVFLRPGVGIHQATGLDESEPQLAGLWRGQYAHKSVAGAVFGIMIMFGLLARTTLLYKLLIVPLEAFFLIKTGDKTIIILILPILVLSLFVSKLKKSSSILFVAITPIVIINSVTIGSIYFDEMKGLASSIVGSASFTGRPELWKLLIKYSSDHPITGAGFQSFWQLNTSSPAQFYGGTWLKAAFYGHQSFLDLLTATGIPGLLFGLLFVIVRPAIDLANIRDRKHPMLAAYVAMWILPLYQGATESIFFEKTSASWVFLLLGIIGLRKIRVEESEANHAQRRAFVAHRSPSLLATR